MVDVERERAAQQQLLHRAERRLDAAALEAIGGWLDVFRYALLQELGVPEALIAAGGGQPANTSHADYAIDNAVARSWGEWQNRLENQVLPTVSIAFGEAFQQTRRGDPSGAFAHQQRYLAEVSDRLKIWPAGAFEDIRPELLESLSDAATIDDMTERIGRVLNIDAKSRKLRAQIGEVDARLLDPETTDPAERAELAALRRSLWESHDEALNEWQWKARRIARTESHGAVCAGQLAAAQERQQRTGVRMFKRWLSTDDTRTRASHRVADGQAVLLDQMFRVGGFLLQHPSDSINVAPHEVINCRCTMLLYDDDELQDEFDAQGGKGQVQPGGVRIGPDDPDEADAAIAEVAEVEQRALPVLGQRGEDHGQALPAEVIDVAITDERTPVPAPDVETASDERLADYLIRTDELAQDELRREVADELARRNESESIEVQFGQPEDAADVLEVDDAGAWLDDPRWADEQPIIDDNYEPDISWDDWPSDDDLPGDVVPAEEPEIVENIGAGELTLEAAQAAHEAALEEFAEAAESGDDARIEAALLAMDETEGRLTTATQLAEVLDIEPTADEVEADTVHDAEWARQVWRYERGDRSTISEVDELAIADYAASSDAINPYLRNRDKLPTDPGVDELVAEIDAAIDRAPVVPEPIQVTRVFTSTQPFAGRLETGDVHTDLAFMSTTLGDDVSPHAAVHMILDVPAGQPGMYVGDLSNFGAGEAELLLPRGTSYEIEYTVDRPDRGPGHVDVFARVVDTPIDHDAEQTAELAEQRQRFVELWGEAAAAEEFDAKTRKLTAAEKRRYKLLEAAEEKALAEGITYEQALAEVQGMDVVTMRRREFVALAANENYVSTNFEDLLSEVHRRMVLDWMIEAEADCNGHLLKPAYRVGSFGHDMLWQVNYNTAKKYMSKEAAKWFDERSRITKAELERMIEAGLIHFDSDAVMQTYGQWDDRKIEEDFLQ